MVAKINYKTGDIIGKYGLIYIEETVPHITAGGRKMRQAIFECPHCKDRTHFVTTIANVKQNKTTSCGCRRRNIAKINGKKTIRNLKGKKIGKLTILYDSGKRQDGHVVWHCICDCGNEIDVCQNNIVRGIQSCGCSKSKGETVISLILNNLNIKFDKEKTFKECINPKTGYPLRFDFYLPDYNCCIEYDGEQHFKFGSGWNTEQHHLSVRQHDQIKNQYCKNNNIRLIRIPYIDYNILTADYLIQKLKEKNDAYE